MQATMTSALSRYFPAEPQPDEGIFGNAAAAFDSRDLLQGRQAIAICHNGALYRLQTTKLGKLILTK